MAEKTLTPIQQKKVIFYEDEITAVLVKEDDRQEIYVALRQLCDLLGVSYQGQIRRINDDPVLSKQVKGVNITFTPSAGRGGGPQTANCLPLDYLNGWLFGINAKRVKKEVRDRLIIYQEKCYKVLADAFKEGQLTADPNFDSLLDTDSPAAQAYKMAAAIMQMARQQMLLEAQVSKHTSRLDAHEARLEQVESTLGDPGRHITPAQAMQISQAVKAIALMLSKRSGRNEYGGVYGEFYRRFEINSYKILPASKFDAAMEFLNGWYQDLVGEGPF